MKIALSACALAAGATLVVLAALGKTDFTPGYLGAGGLVLLAIAAVAFPIRRRTE